MNLKIAGAVGVAIGALLAASGAQAATITWADWTSNTAGTVGAVGLTYAGEQSGFSTTPRYYDPSSSFEGGDVSNAPLATDNSILLTGGSAQIDTITFSTPVVDPIMAIWSLGQGGDTASFNFIGNPGFTLVAGGPTNQYGGGALVKTGENVFGTEGNGVIQFQGTFNSISWTNPTFENFYAFTIGTGAIPEPASWALMIGGFGAVGVSMRRRRAAVAA